MLTTIIVDSIYKSNTGHRLILPKRLALLDDDAADALHSLVGHMYNIGATLYLSDAYRTREEQAKARDDYVTGRKKAYSPPAGESIHEAGRAIDIDIESLGIPLSRFWEVAALYGWRPIITEPKPEASEAWHFEYLAYWYPGTHGLRRCAVLETYLENQIHLSDKARCFLVQGYLKLLGLYVLAIDGISGPGTRKAIEDYDALFGESLTFVGPDIIALGQRVRGLWRHHTLKRSKE